jgi:hypothetical protein
MRKAEVGDAGVEVGGEEDVGRFDVAVDGSGGVEVREAAGSAKGDAHAGEPIQLCAAAATVAVEESGEAAHGHVIVHQQLLVLGEVESAQGDEVAVLQPANRLKLRLEFFPPGGDILQPLHGQDGAVLHDRLVGRPCAPLPEAPLTLLVRKLQNALVSLERFSVVLSHAPPSSSGTASIAAGLSALTQPFKLRLCRATEDFLWPCIKWQEAAAASGAGASTSEESTPIAVSGTERRSTRSRSTVGGANASGQLLKVEAALQILTFCVRTQPMRWW